MSSVLGSARAGDGNSVRAPARICLRSSDKKPQTGTSRHRCVCLTLPEAGGPRAGCRRAAGGTRPASDVLLDPHMEEGGRSWLRRPLEGAGPPTRTALTTQSPPKGPASSDRHAGRRNPDTRVSDGRSRGAVRVWRGRGGTRQGRVRGGVASAPSTVRRWTQPRTGSRGRRHVAVVRGRWRDSFHGTSSKAGTEGNAPARAAGGGRRSVRSPYPQRPPLELTRGVTVSPGTLRGVGGCQRGHPRLRLTARRRHGNATTPAGAGTWSIRTPGTARTRGPRAQPQERCWRISESGGTLRPSKPLGAAPPNAGTCFPGGSPGPVAGWPPRHVWSAHAAEPGRTSQ